MGGFGSRRIGGLSCRPTCDSWHSLDLAWLYREGLLNAGRWSTVRWSKHGQETGSIALMLHEHGLYLRYSTTDDRGAPLTVSELIPFTYTGAGFGGRRRWLKCLSCARVIYGGRYFRCRLCHGLAYKSQIEPDYDRALEQATRIGVRLGDKMFNAFEADELPAKPPRMRWKTYRRLERQFAALQCRWKAGASARFGVSF